MPLAWTPQTAKPWFTAEQEGKYMTNNTQKPTLALVGTTGAVGTVMLELLSTRADVWGEIRLIASARSAGKVLQVRGEDVVVQEIADRKSTRLNSSHVAISYAV